MAKVESAPPAAALAELKQFLRIEDGREDALLSGLLRAATETVEAMLGVLLFEREVEERAVVRGGAIALVAEPARSLTRIQSVASDGELQAIGLDEATFKPGSSGAGRIELPGFCDGSEIVVRYRAGMGADWNWVPEVLRLSVIRAAAHFHAHRDSPDDPGIPPAVRRMLGPWRTRRLR